MPTVKAAPMLPDVSPPDAVADPWAQLDVLDDLDERGAA